MSIVGSSPLPVHWPGRGARWSALSYPIRQKLHLQRKKLFINGWYIWDWSWSTCRGSRGGRPQPKVGGSYALWREEVGPCWLCPSFTNPNWFKNYPSGLTGIRTPSIFWNLYLFCTSIYEEATALINLYINLYMLPSRQPPPTQWVTKWKLYAV